jgi:hypothetical protein
MAHNMKIYNATVHMAHNVKIYNDTVHMAHNMQVTLSICEAGRGAVGCDTAQQVRRTQVRFPMLSLEFFIDIILPTTLWPWGLLSL